MTDRAGMANGDESPQNARLPMGLAGDGGVNKFYVHGAIPRESHASYYYRMSVPLMTMHEMGMGLALIDDFGPDIQPQHRVNAFSNADVNIFYQPVSKLLIRNIEVARTWKQKFDEDTQTWRVPPVFVVDTDDNLFDVNPLNGAFKNLGIRGPDGKDLQDGEAVGIVDENGERVQLWRDGENGLDLRRNRDNLNTFAKLLSLADAVTCSTPEVAAYVQREVPRARTFVSPNCIRFADYPKMEGLSLVKDDPEEVRILWQGSPTHEEDWYPLRHALGYVARKYPKVKFIIWGALYRWATDQIPSAQLIHLPWVRYQEYRVRLCTIGHDINLAPLRNHRFNRCRSAIKFYESSCIWQPAATLAQNAGAYGSEILDGETGVLFDNPSQFSDKLSWLIEDAKERKRLASNAKDWVNENREAFKVVPKLVDFWKQLCEEKRLTCPRMTEEDMAEYRREMEEDLAAAAEAQAKEQAEQARALEGLAVPEGADFGSVPA